MLAECWQSAGNVDPFFPVHLLKSPEDDLGTRINEWSEVVGPLLRFKKENLRSEEVKENKIIPTVMTSYG